MIVSSQMYDIPTSFPSASKVDWIGENINEKYKASAHFSFGTQTFTWTLEQMELGLSKASCMLVTLTGIYKDAWPILRDIQTLCRVARK